MRLWTLFVAALALSTALLSAGAAERKFGLTVDASGTLRREGRPYRGIGVNYFDAFSRTLPDASCTSYEAGFQELEATKLPFCRIMAGGYWPNEQRLYSQDRDAFWKRFDMVVRSAEKHHVGLILSCFWYLPTVPDLMGEPVSAWGDPRSKTLAYMRRYVQDIVTRYRDSPAVWGWEFGNEYSLAADLPNTSEHRPPIVPSLGTPAARTEKDEIGYAAIHAAYSEFAREVRKYDRYRLIESGDSMPRDSAWHNWKEKTWTKDTPEQQAAILDWTNPEGVNAISVHFYTETPEQLRGIVEYARLRKKPLFVGEFGAEGSGEKAAAKFRENLSALVDAGVPLAALWVFDYAGQDTTWNVTGKNDRAYQLRAISEANRRIQLRR